MATNHFGTRLTSGTNLIAGKGLLHGFMISTTTGSTLSVTFFDNTTATGTVLLTVYVAVGLRFQHVMLPRRYSIPFATGLTALFTNCEVNVWATDLN